MRALVISSVIGALALSGCQSMNTGTNSGATGSSGGFRDYQKTAIGAGLGALAGYICNVMFFAVDFRRTEYVQYEDDEYYYYVKAVPKINVANADVRIKHINAKKTKKTDDIRQRRTGDRKSVV